eukprot:TRINITY_DN1227_c0_g2_i1.p1 TRINITY_DN1227_c0_g2~~TRINITY_DN1227_c0_g2_i1.p1  ORF type:complete len:657 (-),score=97.89 TRINITY_DN1227_c0_g2_i1:529-2499(-)
MDVYRLRSAIHGGKLKEIRKAVKNGESIDDLGIKGHMKAFVMARSMTKDEKREHKFEPVDGDNQPGERADADQERPAESEEERAARLAAAAARREREEDERLARQDAEEAERRRKAAARRKKGLAEDLPPLEVKPKKKKNKKGSNASDAGSDPGDANNDGQPGRPRADSSLSAQSSERDANESDADASDAEDDDDDDDGTTQRRSQSKSPPKQRGTSTSQARPSDRNEPIEPSDRNDPNEPSLNRVEDSKALYAGLEPLPKHATNRLFIVCSPRVTYETLKAVFQQYPGLQYLDLKKDKGSSDSKGFAFAAYGTPLQAALARSKLDVTILGNNYLKVDYKVDDDRNKTAPRDLSRSQGVAQSSAPLPANVWSSQKQTPPAAHAAPVPVASSDWDWVVPDSVANPKPVVAPPPGLASACATPVAAPSFAAAPPPPGFSSGFSNFQTPATFHVPPSVSPAPAPPGASPLPEPSPFYHDRGLHSPTPPALGTAVQLAVEKRRMAQALLAEAEAVLLHSEQEVDALTSDVVDAKARAELTTEQARKAAEIARQAEAEARAASQEATRASEHLEVAMQRSVRAKQAVDAHYAELQAAVAQARLAEEAAARERQQQEANAASRSSPMFSSFITRTAPPPAPKTAQEEEDERFADELLMNLLG